MSVFDDLENLQHNLAARIAELEPLVAEYQELRRMSEQISFSVQRPPGDTAPAASGEPGAGARSALAAPAASKPAAAKRAPARRAGARGRTTGASTRARSAAASAEAPAAATTPAPPETPKPDAKPASRRRAGKPASRRRASKPTAASERAPGGTRATGRERRDRILAMIQERPGISVPEISREIGVDAPPLYRVIRKLTSEGLVKKQGSALELV